MYWIISFAPLEHNLHVSCQGRLGFIRTDQIGPAIYRQQTSD
jgi:hypothetical protein